MRLIDAFTDWVIERALAAVRPLAATQGLRLQMASTCRWRTCDRRVSRAHVGAMVRNSCASPAGPDARADREPSDGTRAAPLENLARLRHAALRPVDRRLRHRPFVAGAAARRAVHRAEDRPRLRAAARATTRSSGPSSKAASASRGAWACDRGRGRRDRRTTGTCCASIGCDFGAGLLHRPADAGQPTLPAGSSAGSGRGLP